MGWGQISKRLFDRVFGSSLPDTGRHLLFSHPENGPVPFTVIDWTCSLESVGHRLARECPISSVELHQADDSEMLVVHAVWSRNSNYTVTLSVEKYTRPVPREGLEAASSTPHDSPLVVVVLNPALSADKMNRYTTHRALHFPNHPPSVLLLACLLSSCDIHLSVSQDFCEKIPSALYAALLDYSPTLRDEVISELQHRCDRGDLEMKLASSTEASFKAGCAERAGAPSREVLPPDLAMPSTAPNRQHARALPRIVAFASVKYEILKEHESPKKDKTAHSQVQGHAQVTIALRKLEGREALVAREAHIAELKEEVRRLTETGKTGPETL